MDGMTSRVQRRGRWTAGLAILAALAAAAPAPAQPGARATVVKALAVASAPDAADPTAAIWKKVPATLVPLLTAPPVHPAVSGAASTQAVTVRAIRTGETLYIHLTWTDPSPELPPTKVGSFSDGAAVQFPLDKKETTPILMGVPGARVNIWYWRAGDRVENLLADGFGTLTPSSVQDVTGRGIHANGSWAVVLSRPLKTTAEDGITLEGVERLPVGFAVWNGGNQERDGFKAVTMAWLMLSL